MFGIGNLPISGTIASLATVIFYYLIYNYLGSFWFIFLLIIIFFYSLYFLEKIIKKNYTSTDPKEIVIDEFIGQSIPLIICENNFLLIILSFFLFRLFDITKPWPASYFDLKIKNSIGVIMDDVVAGVYTLLIVYLCI
jgi:phosphatidylglycerophosphatase A